LAYRLAGVSVGEVHAHEGAMRAFSQRLACDCEQTYLERLRKSALMGEPVAERLERTQAQLAKALAFEDRPVLVPVWKQVGGKQFDVGLGSRFAAEKRVRRRLHLTEIDHHVAAQAERAAGCVDQPRLDAVDAPERGAEIRSCAFVSAIQPERSGDVAAKQGSVVKRDERDDALSAERKLRSPCIARDLEAVKETQPNIEREHALRRRCIVTRCSSFPPQQRARFG